MLLSIPCLKYFSRNLVYEICIIKDVRLVILELGLQRFVVLSSLLFFRIRGKRDGLRCAHSFRISLQVVASSPVPNLRERNDATASVDSALRFFGRTSLRLSLSPSPSELASTLDVCPLLLLLALLVSTAQVRALPDRTTVQCKPKLLRAKVVVTLIAPRLWFDSHCPPNIEMSKPVVPHLFLFFSNSLVASRKQPPSIDSTSYKSFPSPPPPPPPLVLSLRPHSQTMMPIPEGKAKPCLRTKGL